MGRVETQGTASLRRKQASKMREVKHGIRRLEKLMRAVSDFQNAIKLMICEVPSIQGAILVLGASPLRPQHVYELCFWHGESVPSNAHDFTKTKAAEVLSKKVLSAIPASTPSSQSYLRFTSKCEFTGFLSQAIRALISKGAGSGSYPGWYQKRVYIDLVK